MPSFMDVIKMKPSQQTRHDGDDNGKDDDDDFCWNKITPATDGTTVNDGDGVTISWHIQSSHC